MMLSDVCLSDDCLSVAYIGPKSRTERPRTAKIGTEVTHVIRNSEPTFKVKKVKVTGLRHIVAAFRTACLCRYITREYISSQIGTIFSCEWVSVKRLWNG